MERSNAIPAVTSVDSDRITFGAVHLDVTNMDRALAFWRDLVGLQLLSGPEPVAVLGVPGNPLVALHPGATGPLPRNYSGLYHLAIHVPTMEDFSRVYLRARSIGYPQYPTDHLTHYANYLDDADGNGLEMVFESIERVGSMHHGAGGFHFVDADGNPHSGRAPIDLDWLASFVPDRNLNRGIPDGSVLGHVHLRVASMDESLAFYEDQIGFVTNMNAPGIGMYDMAAGGTFPHRLAGNIWESGGRPQRPEGAAGLRFYTLVYRHSEERDQAVARVEEQGGAVEQWGEDTVASDPSGNRLLLALSDPSL